MFELLIAAAGALLVLLSLWDAFLTVVVPGRITVDLHLLGMFHRFLWPAWAGIAERLGQRRRQSLLSVYSSLTLLLQIALWVVGLIVGFGTIQWMLPASLNDPNGPAGLGSSLYFSGVTFVTLGFGDTRPVTGPARFFAVVEAGIGFVFLALVISYLPMFYQSFSRREILISLLDARAGSPPTAGELLRRSGPEADLTPLLSSCEVWAAEVLESHMSYPTLAFFPSQHEHQSWIATLTVMLDTCALLLACTDSGPPQQAQLAYAMARHAVVDLVQVLNVRPSPPAKNRLPATTQEQLWQALREAGFSLREASEVQAELGELRQMYEPYVNALATFLRMPLPPWVPEGPLQDAWEASPYDDVHWYRVVETYRRSGE